MKKKSEKTIDKGGNLRYNGGIANKRKENAMSVSLTEILEGAGYDLDDLDDLYKVQSLLYEAEDLAEEVNDKIDYLENRDPEAEAEEARADYEIMRSLGK